MINFCKDYNPNGGNDGNNGGSNGGSSNSTSDSSSDSDVNVGGIVAGILVPLIVIGLAIGGYCYWKKRKNSKKEEELANKRKGKEQQQPGSPKRKKANEFNKNAIQKKMENEGYNSVKITERDPAGNTMVLNSNLQQVEEIQLDMDEIESEISNERSGK